MLYTLTSNISILKAMCLWEDTFTRNNRLCDGFNRPNLQAKVSATIRLFGGDSSHTPFFDWQSFQGNTLYPLAIIHMEHINVLDFYDKSEKNFPFPLET